MSSENAYSRPVTLKNILKFAVPTIVMTVFMSFYTMVDGLFVSNLIGTDALSAVNLTAPIISLVTAISTMLATGGSAVIMRKVGERKTKEANEDFTFLIVVNVIVGLVMSTLGYLVMDSIFESMNLSSVVFNYCHDYLSRYLIFTIPILLMNNFTLYMIAAGKSNLSMVCSITGGVLNIVLDYVLITVLNMGITGAAIATGLGYSVTAVVGIILFSSGSAVIMRKVGERKTKEANEDFTFLIVVNVIVGLVMSALGYLVMDTIFENMNLSLVVFNYCHDYLSCYLIFTIPILLMNNFTLYMIAVGKSNLSMICSITGGVLNMVLDYVLIAVLNMGITGAAIATGLGYSVTAVVGIILFSKKNSLLHFVKPVCRRKILWEATTNGSSEMATALVTGIVTMMFNWTMLKYVGENGIAAITIIMYVLMFATSLYTGYSYGVAPMISFYYGEQNNEKLKKLIHMSLKIIGVIAVVTLAASLVITEPLVSVFARPDNPVYDLAVTGNRICSLALIFIGFNVFASGMFTALSNGVISAILAFSRSFVFMVIAMLILPALFDVTGVWLATPVAEFAAICLSLIMFGKYRKSYGY